MAQCTIHIRYSSYTLSTEDIKITKVDNRRYTMRDIKLESRIENVEYYTQLSLLEIQHKIYKYKTQTVLIDLKMDL